MKKKYRSLLKIFVTLTIVVVAVCSASYAVEVSSVISETELQNEVVNTKNIKIGDAEYETLQDAVNAVEDGGTITLLDDVEGTGVKVPTGKKFTLDLGGFTYTVADGLVGSTGTETNGFQLLMNSDITIKNGTITKTSTKKGILIQNYSNLTLDNVKVVGSENTTYALSNNFGDTVLTNGTEITATEGNVAFDVYYGMNKNGDYDAGVSVTIASDDVKINGKVEYGKANRVSEEDFLANAVIEVPEGMELELADGLVIKDNKVSVQTAPIKIGNREYETLQEAVNNVESDEIIILSKDLEGTGVKVESGKKFTLDLNGHTYTVADGLVGSTGTETNGFQLLMNSDITIKNGKITKTSEKKGILIQNYSNLTLDNVEVVGSENTTYALSNNFGDTVLKNGTKITATEGNVAFDAYYGMKPAYDEGVSVTIASDDVEITGKVEYAKASRIESEKDFLNKAVITVPEGMELTLDEGFVIKGNKVTMANSYTITVTAGANGTISPSETVTVVSGDDQEFTITADKGYVIKDVKVDGESVGAVSTYKFEKISGDHTIEAEFKKESTSGGSTGGSTTTKYTITVKVGKNGTISPDGTVKVEKGEDKKFTFKANEGYEIEDVLVDGKSVGKVSSYTFENVKEAHKIEVTFKKIEEAESKNVFTDVNSGDWFYTAVEYVYDNGLMEGVGDDKFDPNAVTTRAMMVTILYNLENKPAVKNMQSYDDVEADAWYAQSIAWAKENGIVLGIGDDKFAPNEEVTREQMITMLCRYAAYKELDTKVTDDSKFESYSDSKEVSEYAISSLKWACEKGLINGRSESTLAPVNNSTRAEIAQFVCNFHKKMVK